MFNDFIKKTKEIQNEINNIRVSGESGAGLVKVILNGSYNCLKINIKSELYLYKNKNIIEDLIAAAINNAANKISKIKKEKMIEISKNIKLPFNFNI